MTGEEASGVAGEPAMIWFVSGWAQASQKRAPSDRGAPQFGQYRFTSDINAPVNVSRVVAQVSLSLLKPAGRTSNKTVLQD